jgi:CarD family transcriptional regulator
MTLFQIGEKIVYPNHGIGTVENISTRSFGAQFERYYLLRLTYNSMTVMVPFSHVQEIGLRKVTRNGEIARVLSFLAEGNASARPTGRIAIRRTRTRCGTAACSRSPKC